MRFKERYLKFVKKTLPSAIGMMAGMLLMELFLGKKISPELYLDLDIGILVILERLFMGLIMFYGGLFIILWFMRKIKFKKNTKEKIK